MKLIGGLSRDVAANDQQPGTYRHAENVLLTKLNQAVATEPGTVAEYNKSGYDLIGVIPVRDDASVLFYVEDDYNSNPSYLSEIVYLDADGNETLIVSHADLAFSPEHPFKGVYYYNTKDELIIAWTDNNNPPRILNVDAPEFTGTTPDAKYIKRLSVFPQVSVPSVKGVLNTNEAGSIQNGAYTFFISYEIEEDQTTNYIGGYGSYLVGNGGDIDGVSSLGISLDFKNLDTNYDYVRIYAVKTAGSTKTGHYLKRLEIPTSGSLSFIWTGGESAQVPYEDIIINNASYTTAKSLTVLNDRLYLANLTTDSFFDYQPYANAITSQWTFEQNLNKVGTGEKNLSAEEYGSYRGFMPGATYAFYISFVLKDGTYSPAFHIPGRLSSDATVYDSVNSTSSIRKIDTNDYSTYTGTVTETDPHAGSSYTFHYGDMGFHRNESETYPNSDSWNVKNASGTVTGNIKGDNVRHHKFPSIQKMAANIGSFNQKNIVYGVRFNNIALPTELLDKVQGYTIFYAARSFGDMDVISYIPILDQDFQDTENWDSTGSYPATPGCGAIGTPTCYEYTVTNTSYQNTAEISYTDCAGVVTTMTLYPGQITTIYADRYSITATSGTIDTVEEGAYAAGTNTLGCDAAPVKSGKLRIYDPMLLAKKPALSNLFTMPEWYNNQPWKNTSGDLLSAQESWASGMSSIEYMPANNSAVNNTEREEAAVMSAGNIIAGRWQGKGQFLYQGIGGHIGDEIMISSLRQYIPNMYVEYSNQLLASTSVVHDLRDPDLSDPFISGTVAAKYARTPRIYGGDVTLERVRFEYMTAEDNNNTDMLLISGSGTGATTTVVDYNHQGYTYFVDNTENKSVRRAMYVAPSRIPATKFYADPGLQPNLTSKVITTYSGEYLNQYLINPAYETINTTKPAFPFDDIGYQGVTGFPSRIARSVVQQSESNKLQWRTFRSQDYYEHIRSKGDITNIESHNGELLIHHEQSLFKTIGKDQLAGDATSIYLGTGDIFQLPPREVIDTPQGYGGNQHLAGTLLTKAGYFFLDLEQRKIFNVTDKLNEISAKGMRNWFRDNMEFSLKQQLQSKGIEDLYSLYDAPAHLYGNGFTVAYDEEYNRFLLAKKSWKFTATGLTNLANATEHGQAYVEGKIYFVGGIPKLAVDNIENPGQIIVEPLDMASNNVEYDSWTVSYSPAIDRWVSFHSYKPTLLWNTRNKLFSFTDQIYTHNTGVVGSYYGTTYPMILDVPFNPSPTQSKVFVNFNWITESINTSGGSVKKDTFTHATVYNSYQLSSRTTLTEHTSLRESEGTWYFNTFRDKLETQNSDIVNEDFSINYNLLDTAKPWYKQRRFIDKYAVIRLEYDNSTGNTLYLYEASPAVRVSNR